MGHRRSAAYPFKLLGVVGFALAALAGCTGDDGAQGPAGPSGGSSVHVSTATELNVTITSATVASPPVVSFKVTDQNGMPVNGLTLNDLRFTIAKLTPGASGNPSAWQNYVNVAASGNLRPIAEGGSPTNCQSSPTTVCGTLVDNKDGTFTYTFKTDIASVSCPAGASCTDVSGNAINLSYDGGLAHRVGLQTRGAVPIANVVYDFRPSDRATTGLFAREIAKTGKCNECHNKLAVHGGSRIETKYCVTCHNPGNITTGTSGTTVGNLTVDFKVLIHKIHMDEELPSVRGADGLLGTADDGKYIIGTTNDFSTVVFPMGGPSKVVGELRYCTKCHDGADPATPQGDNWKTQPSREACGACHDSVNFATGANHPGGVQVDNSTCLACHSTGGAAGTVDKSHEFPTLAIAESNKYKFNILTVTNTTPGLSPVITFSITDPTNGNAKRDLKNDTTLSAGSISLLVGWNNTDENNTGSSAPRPGQPVTMSLTGTSAANAVDNGDMTYTVNLATATLGTGITNRVIPLTVTGSGRVAVYGRAAVDLNPKTAGAERVRIQAAFKDFGITDATPVARRKVVDITKCDKCHGQLSLHGDGRTDEPGLCVICHNPNATDAGARVKIVGGADDGFPNAALVVDGNREEAIDFKRMIHGIHAGAKTDYTGNAAHGFRQKGLVIASNSNDYSHVRFPGILNDCFTCHTTKIVNGTTFGTFELTGTWEVPTASGVLGSTMLAAPNLPSLVPGAASYATQVADQADDLNITPTAAVCSACHDGVVAKSHMQLNGALFGVTQATITQPGAPLEACAICHGPGRLADVKVMHGVK